MTWDRNLHPGQKKRGETNLEIKEDLYNEKGELASFGDVAKWFNKYYPADIFIKHDIAGVRDKVNELAKKLEAE